MMLNKEAIDNFLKNIFRSPAPSENTFIIVPPKGWKMKEKEEGGVCSHCHGKGEIIVAIGYFNEQRQKCPQCINKKEE